jgi:long-chain fatty acid transport protein
MATLPRWSRAAALAAAVLGCPAVARAGGFEVPNQGARASGQAETFLAQADDASAIYYNPAGLTQLKGSSFMSGLYFVLPSWRFEGSDGDAQNEMVSVLPHFYFESDFGTERWRFGVGANNVHGLNEHWGDFGPLRTIVTDARLMVINVAPTVAYQVNEHLSLGIAFNAYYGDVDIKKNVILGPPPTPEGRSDVGGDDWAFGVTPGIFYKINERHAIGGLYRSAYTLDFDGHGDVRIPGVGHVGPSHVKAKIDFPQQAGIGYAYRPNDKWKLEADLMWTQWGTLDVIRLRSPDANFNGQTIPQDWEDGFSLHLGTQYQIDEHWVARAGYSYGQNAVPNTTFSPLVPDSNYHLFALGLGYGTPRWSIDAAYHFTYREDRHINDGFYAPVVIGDWENRIHALMVSFTYRF